ncbi:MAG: ankyrin repeat domain-containing protein [Bdellovibrionota bacterium]|nr:MAG: ankyrin repeat domain-containing protein [Bdellovibrionota bacterium]
MHRITTLIIVITACAATSLMAQADDPFYDLNAALGMAVQQGDLAYAEKALQLGAHTELPDSEGRTPLLLAVKKGDIELVRLLASRNARIDASDNKGYSALHILAGEDVKGGDAVAKVCIDYGHPLNPTDKAGNTPLHLASAAGNETMVRLLIAVGASVNLKNSANKTAMEVAKSDEIRKIMQVPAAATNPAAKADRPG